MRSLLAICCFAMLASHAVPADAAQNEPKDVAALQQVVETFRRCFIDKDVATFRTLFYSDRPEDVVWQFVVEDSRLARIQKFRPEARKARHVPTNNYLTAIQAIAADPRTTEEVFSNTRIDTDGEVASVNFDYIVRHDGEEQNWGREMWHLVRTDAGWKIISVVYSARDPLPKDRQPSVREATIQP